MPHEQSPIATLAISLATPRLVADLHLAPQLAEIGVVLLMFCVGTHFTLRDLTAVKAVAVRPSRSRWHWHRSASSPSSWR
jgi:predicted Kef-type K+ transport protein